MKKYLAVLLAVCFIFCLAACGNKPTENGDVCLLYTSDAADEL